MRAIILSSFGSTDQLVYQDIPTPAIAPHQVLVQVAAISINPVDVKTRKGKGQAGNLQRDNPMILGWDISGTIVSTGETVTEFREGDEVFGMINIPGHGKAYTEYVAADAAHLSLKPSNISHEQAAAACLAAMTAWQALTLQMQIHEGQRILIHAASGGVGHFAVQMAKHFGAYVIGTSSAANRDFVLSLGANEHIDYQAVPFEKTSPQVDLVLDGIGGDNIDRSLQVLAPGGTIVSLPSGISESVTEKANAQGKKGIFFFVKSDGDDMRNLAGLLQQGILHSHISRVYSFDEIKEAHDEMEKGKTVGKIVVRVR